MSVLDQFKLDGQVVVVTGGGRGIGEAIALGMAEAGADIVVAARRTAEIEAVAEKVRSLGRKSLAVTTDMMEIEQVQSLADRTKRIWAVCLVGSATLVGQMIESQERF